MESITFFRVFSDPATDWKEYNSKKKWLYNTVRDHFSTERKFTGLVEGIGMYGSGLYRVSYKDHTTFDFSFGGCIVLTNDAHYLKGSEGNPFFTDERFDIEKTLYEFSSSLLETLKDSEGKNPNYGYHV